MQIEARKIAFFFFFSTHVLYVNIVVLAHVHIVSSILEMFLQKCIFFTFCYSLEPCR